MKLLIYIGRRITNSGKLAFGFVEHAADADGGKVYWWGKVKCVRVGGMYEVTTDADGRFRMDTMPDERAAYEGPEVEVWERDDVLSREIFQRQRAAKRLENEPAILATVSRLRPLLTGLTRHERRVLVEYLVDKTGQRA